MEALHGCGCDSGLQSGAHALPLKRRGLGDSHAGTARGRLWSFWILYLEPVMQPMREWQAIDLTVLGT